MTTTPSQQPLATYEDLRYRDVFWARRAYEDGSDRLALRALLAPSGGRLLEVGAGFGRLVDEYGGYREVILLDASEVHVDAARERLGADPRIEVVLGDALHLPFPDASVDAAVCVRVLHHFEDPRLLIGELARVVRPEGSLVLEFANKRNLKAIASHLLRRGAPSPFAPGPKRYRELHFDHAPVDVRRWLAAAGFQIEATRTASLFRISALSRRIPTGLLLAIERPLQSLLAPVTPGPSVFHRAIRRS